VIGVDPIDLLAAEDVGLAKSKGEARRNANGYSVNQVRLPDRDGAPLGEQDLLHGRFLLLGRGKRNHHLITVGG
jgi:tyrosyl-tRNA synthetase